MAGDMGRNLGQSLLAKTREKLQRLPLWRQALLALVLTGMVTVAGVILAAHLAERRLGREVIKISKAGEPLVYADLRSERTGAGTGEDAALYYIEAIRKIRPADLEGLMKSNVFYRLNMVSLPADKFPGELREKVGQNLTKAEPVLAMLDKGAQLPLSEFDIGVLRGKQILKDRLDSVQGAVFLSSLRTLDLIRTANAEKATESVVTTLRLIRAFDTFPTTMVQGRKMICVRLVCSDIQLLLIFCHPLDKQLERLQSLLDEAFRSDSLERTLLAERVYQLEVGRNLFTRTITSRFLSPDVPSLPERLATPKFTWHRMRICAGAARFLRDMAWFIKNSRLPWPGPLNEIKDASSTPSKGASGLILSVVPLTRLIAETLVTTECVKTVVAIERYRREEKVLPDRLEDICPRYIQAIPLDPFTGRAVLYTHDDKSYRVYSAAKIRIDDVNSIIPESGASSAGELSQEN